MKGKKGAWTFDIFFILVIMVVLGAAFAAVHGKTNISKNFGDLQKTILETYNLGEKMLFYVDYSAKNSIYQAIYDLGQNGGFYKRDYISDIEYSEISFYEIDYIGYSLWHNPYPDKNSLKNNFGLYFNNLLNNYLLQYPEDILIPLDNYDFLIDDDKIVGIAIENIEFDVKEKQSDIGRYSIKPSFNQKLDLDIFEDYNVIVDKAKQLENICKSVESTESCVNNNKNIFDTDNLILSDDCEAELKKAFNHFAEEVYLCANSENNSCICKFRTLDGSYDSVYIEKNNVKMIDDDQSLFEYNFNVDYEGSSNFKPDKEVILLKVSDRLSEYDKEDLPFCTTKKDTFRFCVESNNKVYAYDKEDGQIKLRNIEYRFALKFE